MTKKEKIALVDHIVSNDKFPTIKKTYYLLRKEHKVNLNDALKEYIRTEVLFALQDRIMNCVHVAQISVYTKYLKIHFPEEWDAQVASATNKPVQITIDFTNTSENKL